MFKSFSAFIFVLILAACTSPNFYDGEYSTVVDIRHTAEKWHKSGKNCNIEIASSLQDKTSYLVMYTEHLNENENAHSMATILNNLTSEIKNRVETKKVSKFYCKEKLQNIIDAAERMQIAIAKKDRLQ